MRNKTQINTVSIRHGLTQIYTVFKFISLCALWLKNSVAKRKGVTLTEMMVVVAIAALMLGLTIPATNMLLNSFESESGAKSIISAAMASARAIAAKEQRYAGIRFQKRYDPNNPDPLNESQYIIFIIYDHDLTKLENGFRAADGIQPIKLPDSIGVMDLCVDDRLINNNVQINEPNEVNDTTTFSIIFSPSGKLVIHDVQTRNRDGKTNDTSPDDIFNTVNNIRSGIAMFIQDNDAYHALGFQKEPSRNNFIIYDTKKFRQAYNNSNAYSGYLNQPNRFYINPYTGTIINER